VSEESIGPVGSGSIACPFVAYEEDRDHRSDHPDYRHRCFAAAEPEPRAFPHQERYCLSSGFAECPIFLDWARQEAAGISRVERPAVNAAIDTQEPDEAPTDDGVGAPAFLAGRERPLAEPGMALPPSTPPVRRTDAGGLWGYDDEPQRPTPAPGSYTVGVGVPRSPSSGVAGAGAASDTSVLAEEESPVAMARRSPSKPSWENPPKFEKFPRLRDRHDSRGSQSLLLAAISVAVLMTILWLGPMLPIFGSAPTPTPVATQSTEEPSQSATPEPTATPMPDNCVYIVRGGDTMGTIAEKLGVTLTDLEAANSWIPDFDHIQAAWKLTIPGCSAATPSPTP
jgi:hypothetical protein